MYNLESGNFNNKNTIALINRSEDNKNQCLKYIDQFENNEIFYKIFNIKDKSNDLENNKEFSCLSIILTLGSERKIPLSNKICSLLYFVLLINFNPKNNLNITNMNQAWLLFDYSNGDYTKIFIDEDDRTPDWIIINKNESKNLLNIFPDGVEFSLKIPISHHSFTDQTMFMVSGIDHCFIVINGVEYKLFRHIYLTLFNKYARFYTRDSFSLDSVKKRFLEILDPNFDNISKCIESIGFSLIKTCNFIKDCKFVYMNGSFYINDLDSINEDDKYLFKAINDKNYLLLPRLNDYLPIFKNSNNLNIFIKGE